MRWLLTILCLVRSASGAAYAGPETCAQCHRTIAATQAQTAMANTWQDARAPMLPTRFTETKTENRLHYEVNRSEGALSFTVTAGTAAKTELPVEAIVGGERHGTSFLTRLSAVKSIPLARPVLIEGRYAYSPRGMLVLSPGFDPSPPTTKEDELGRVLSPGFEQRCLTCHGRPGTLGAGTKGGVHCESCHGPSADHAKSPAQSRPAALSGLAGMSVCAQCHTGLSTASHEDPLPGDLLVSSQVPALSHSECFIQSGQALTCTGCHNPHRDAAGVVPTSIARCLTCHAQTNQQHAAICPINATGDCVRCHMPAIPSNSFRLTDHWIRVHPEAGIKAPKLDPALLSRVVPKREYLRILVTSDREKAAAAQSRLASGDPFETVAHDLSIDPTAPGGGFIGDTALADMDPRLTAAAAKLSYGETSGLVEQPSGRFLILHRLSRDFRWQAGQLFDQAVSLKEHGHLQEAVAKDQAALQIYPYFLRALVFLGTALGEARDAERAASVLQFAVSSYPKDASAQFDLGLALQQHPVEQIAAFRRALDLDPDMVEAYQSLGSALYTNGQAQNALHIFRQGLAIDPLSAILNYDLGLALREQGNQAGARQALDLAAQLDPEIARRQK